MRASIRALTSTAVLSCLTLLVTPARAAWDYVPTAAEWQTWPVYCRAQYSWVNSGFEFQYGGTVPRATVEHWRQVIGDYTFTGLHHWCASIHFLERARRDLDPKMRDFNLNRASEDAMFSWNVTDRMSPVFPDMAVTLAQIRDAMGRPDQAEAVLKQSIQAQPKRSEPYVVLAMMNRKQHKLPAARDVLKQADEVTAGMSAEVQYNLGLINLELGDTAAARANARTAYALGYPLPGLKNLLRRKGQWNAEDDSAVQALVAENRDKRAATVAVAEPPRQGDGESEANAGVATPAAVSE
jgi:hypothetical protein